MAPVLIRIQIKSFLEILIIIKSNSFFSSQVTTGIKRGEIMQIFKLIFRTGLGINLVVFFDLTHEMITENIFTIF